MGFPTKNDHFGVFWVYHHFRKHPASDVKLPHVVLIGSLGEGIDERASVKARRPFVRNAIKRSLFFQVAHSYNTDRKPSCQVIS